MALTQVKTSGLADDAVTGAKIADDTVAEANIANDAISLTELKAGTDGQIISWDASGNPVAVGPGTDGQVLTSTGAGSPPAFEDVPAGGATINNATANELVTVASTTTQLDAESNLTFDGEQLNITHAGTTDPENQIVLQTSAIDTGGGSGVFFKSSSSTTANRYGSRIHTTREAGGASNLIFSTEITGGTTGLQEALKISPNKNVTVSDGDLVIGTSGHGISFAATADGSGASNESELFSDYEHGEFTPKLYLGNTEVGYDSSNTGGTYVKIGKFVWINALITVNTQNNATGGLNLRGFPFDQETSGSPRGGGYICQWYGQPTGWTNQTIHLSMDTDSKCYFRYYSGHYMGDLSGSDLDDSYWFQYVLTYFAD